VYGASRSAHSTFPSIKNSTFTFVEAGALGNASQ
jgi:hypothetical protein